MESTPPWKCEQLSVGTTAGREADRLPFFLTLDAVLMPPSTASFLQKGSDTFLQDECMKDSVRAILCPDIEVHHQL